LNYTVEEFYYHGFDDTPIYTKCWRKDKPKAIIQIAHGLGEIAEYYSEFACKAVEQGYAVYINEKRGQGRTGGKKYAGNPGKNSLHKMVEDIHSLTNIVNETYKGIPIYLIGHSLGAILVQLYAEKYKKLISGVVLIGLPKIKNTHELYETVIKEIKEKGEKSPSQETFVKMFSSVNTPFEPVKTALDWITTDDEKIEQFMELSYTNVLYSNEFYKDFIGALIETQKVEFIEKFPKELPILLLAGSEDVLNDNGVLVKRHCMELIKIGVKDAKYNIYEKMRHSLLQEKNRNLVEKDIISWIKAINLQKDRKAIYEIKMDMV